MHRSFRCALVVTLTTVLSAQQLTPGRAQDTTIAPTTAPTPVASPGASPTSGPSGHHAVRRRAARRIHRVRHRRHTESGAEIPSGLNAAGSATPGDRLSLPIRLDDGLKIWKPSRRMLGVKYAPGSSDESPGGTVEFVVDREKLKRYLLRLKPYADHAPIAAHPVVANPSAADDGAGQVPAKIIPDRPGGSLDVDAAVDRIQHAIQSDATTTHIALPMIPKPAPSVASQLAGIDTRIGYFVTRFNPGEVGRTQTVRRAIDLIDGTIVPPGGIFSINQSVGERTAERGFGVGHVFKDGKMVKELGGGMCQVATTLFNAAMLADLKIVERHQHVRTVPYVAPGRDATVYWGQKDFKIQNDTDAPLYISYKTTYSHAIVTLFGKGAPGRKVTLVSHYRQLAERHFTGVFYRIVSYPDGHTEKSHPYYSDYVWTPALDFSR